MACSNFLKPRIIKNISRCDGLIELDSIITLKKNQLIEAVDLLKRVFVADPMMLYIFPDDLERRRLMHPLCAATIKYSHLYGETYSTEQVEGVACWLRPGQNRLSFFRLLRSGMILLPFRIGKSAWLRFNNVLAYTEQAHLQAVSEPHWHLWSLAVDPSVQGRGIGSALIHPVLARADADNQACYLDSFSELNIGFYKKHNFYVVSQGEIEAGGPRVWAMVREAGLVPES